MDGGNILLGLAVFIFGPPVVVYGAAGAIFAVIVAGWFIAYGVTIGLCDLAGWPRPAWTLPAPCEDA